MMPESEPAQARRDARFKELFNRSRIVEEFLRAVAPEEFAASVDFSTASQAGGDFVDGGLRSRRADRVWRVRTKGGGEWMHLHILIEFQSRPGPMMAKRILECVLALREQAWTAPLDYPDLVEGGSERLRECRTRQVFWRQRLPGSDRIVPAGFRVRGPQARG